MEGTSSLNRLLNAVLQVARDPRPRLDWVMSAALGLAAFGVPAWLTYPLVGYALLFWWQRRLDLPMLGLSAAVNLLVIPYSRSYDYVLLLLPLAAVWRAPPSPQRRIALSLTIAAQLLPLIRAFIPRAGLLEALGPALCTLALLCVSRLRWRELRFVL